MSLRLLTKTALLSFFLLGSIAGCSGDDDQPGTVCGGVVGKDGKCKQKCDKDNEAQFCAAVGVTGSGACIESEEHPEGQCQQTCTAVTDCAVGYECKAGVTSMTQGSVSICSSLNLPNGGGQGVTCADNTACDQGHGFICISGTCQPDGSTGDTCTADTDCLTEGNVCIGGKCGAKSPEGGACEEDTDCKSADLVCKGGTCGKKGDVGDECSTAADCETAGGPCVNGTCLKPCTSSSQCADGEGCKLGGCLEVPAQTGEGGYGTICTDGNSQCDTDNDYVCFTPQIGADPFCTQLEGCTADTDCPMGFWCGEARTADADGNWAFGQNKKACLANEFCSPCATDADCQGFNYPGSICVAGADGEKFCTVECNPDSNSCITGAGCREIADGRTVCTPDAGACHDANPTGCSACRVDSDCGDGGVCWSNLVGGYRPELGWCSVPCGAGNSGKDNVCPVADTTGGLEMICLDENVKEMFFYGDGWTEASAPDYMYKHCMPPLTIDASTAFLPKDFPLNACGNGVREEGEECDDNSTANDGCTNCKVDANCKFTHDEADDSGTLLTIPDACKTAVITGSLTAGDIDSVMFTLREGPAAWVETFTNNLFECDADLVLEVRGGTVDTNKGCDSLSQAILNLEAASPSFCPGSPTHMGCGSCSLAGLCGVCDDDNGLNGCNRVYARTVLNFDNGGTLYPVYFDSKEKTVRVYAKDDQTSVDSYKILISRIGNGPQGGAYGPYSTCWR